MLGLIIFALIIVAVFCYIVYKDLPSKYIELEESFGGFMNKGLVRFEFEKSPLHIIVYGATRTSKTFFVRQYLKLYQNQMVEEDRKRVIIVCKDDRDWIDHETGRANDKFEMCETKMITSKI